MTELPVVLRDAYVAGLDAEREMLRAAIAAQAAAYEQAPEDPVEELRREVGLLREENHKLIGDLATAESDRDTARSQRDSILIEVRRTGQQLENYTPQWAIGYVP